MLTGKALVESLVDDLNVLGMPNMAATLEGMYSSPGFLEMDHLTLIAELIGVYCIIELPNGGCGQNLGPSGPLFFYSPSLYL